MATQQEELLQALKSGGGRQQTNFDPAQISLRPTIQRGGQYNVQVQQAPQTNPALQLADALKGGSQLLNQFVDIQTKQGEIEANALTPEEVVKRVEQGDPNAGSFLDKLGKEKTFVETTYKRYFNSTVQPQLKSLGEELQNRPMQEYAEQGITTQEDFKVYAENRVKELTDKFGEYTNKSPYAKVLHNQLIENIIPDLVHRQVTAFDSNVTKYNLEEISRNLPQANADNGVNLKPITAGEFKARPDSTVTDFGQTGKPQKAGAPIKLVNGKPYVDPDLDTNSALAIGFKVPPDQQERIKKGLPSIHRMVNGDIAVSPDVRADLEAQGVQYMDKITIKLEDGTLHTGRWMDVTAEVYKGKNLSGRFDIYTPEGRSPIVGKKVASWSRDAATAEQRFNENVNNIVQIGAESLITKGKASPADAGRIVKKDLGMQVSNLASSGQFVEARKLLGALNNVKLGGQPLFGSTEGRANFLAMEDLVDREEDQFSAENERTSKIKLEKIVDPFLIDFRKDVASGMSPTEAHQKYTDLIMKDQRFTPTEQVKAFNQLDTLYTNQNSLEFARASNADKAILKLQQDGGSTFVINDIASITTQQGAESFISATPDLQDLAFTTNMDGKKMLNPAFTTIADNVVGRLLPKYNRLNQDYTVKIMTGQSFDYEVAGKPVRFEGTPDKEAQKDLHMRLANTFRQDFGNAVTNELKKDMQIDPVFAVRPSTVDPTQAQKLRKTSAEFEAQGLSKEESDKAAIKLSIEESKGVTLIDANGNIRPSPNFWESEQTYVDRYVNDLNSGRLMDSKKHATAYNNVKYVGNKVALTKTAEALQARTPAEQLKSRSQLNEHFKNVGIPWDAVKKGQIEVDVFEYGPIGSGGAGLIPTRQATMVKGLYSLDYIFSAPNSESTYQLIPLNIMQNLDNPKAKAAVQKIADDRYGGDYNRLVKGQENWYSSKNISLTK